MITNEEISKSNEQVSQIFNSEIEGNFTLYP